MTTGEVEDCFCGLAGGGFGPYRVLGVFGVRSLQADVFFSMCFVGLVMSGMSRGLGSMAGSPATLLSFHLHLLAGSRAVTQRYA